MANKITNWIFSNTAAFASRDYTIAPPILDVKLDEYFRSDWAGTIEELIDPAGFNLEELFLPKLAKLKPKVEEYKRFVDFKRKAKEYEICGQSLSKELVRIKPIFDEHKKLEQELGKLKPDLDKHRKLSKSLKNLTRKAEKYKKITFELTELEPESEKYKELDKTRKELKPKAEKYEKIKQELANLKPAMKPVFEKFKKLDQELAGLREVVDKYNRIHKKLTNLKSASEKYKELAPKAKDLESQSKECKKLIASLEQYRSIHTQSLSCLKSEDGTVEISKLAKMCQDMHLGETEQPKCLRKLVKDWEAIITAKIRPRATNLPENTDVKSILAAAANVLDTSKEDGVPSKGSLLTAGSNIQKRSGIGKGIPLSDKIPDGVCADLEELIMFTKDAVCSAHERESGLTDICVTSLMYRSRDARSAVLTMFLEKRYSYLNKSLDQMPILLLDRVISPFFYFYAKQEFSSENLDAYKRILKLKKSKKISRHKARAFYEKYLDTSGGTYINIPGTVQTKIESVLEAADKSKTKNMWELSKFTEVIDAIQQEVKLNISDTFNRYRYSIYCSIMQKDVSDDDRGNEVRALKSNLLIYIR